MRTFADFLNGRISTRDKVMELQASSIHLDTPAQRFHAIMKLEWFYWSTQQWNSNFTEISFDAYCRKHDYYLLPECDNFVAHWVRTGTTI